MDVKPQNEHRWLERLVGEWSYEHECKVGDETSKWSGREVVRSLGGLWTIAEGEGEMPCGGTGQTIMTLGYDPQKKRYVGTFLVSVMAYLWVYEGSVDASGKRLVLDTVGPKFSQDGTPLEGTARYQDIVEIIDDDHRILRSQVLGDDGQWHPIMTGHYRRTKR
ncbi:MAG TPA: DUF1579 domain-containing protein [Phycisphaerae bacterium]|nr:DUF1579 domain-containing protein [Phycisphaerae bacterium]HOJ74130.1 DUF1579 domain-containing protein [Phycisphaerae bacterium]HOM50724.1 DUF1579 domain-containing protein [Phycisphaerae bacterium]HOQ87553.1 DUF1579 domain-containing protein [Phycisphaerae bacterium]HPP26092.1 DUF1579 domain-containing protein [Phycisphaerae bacterium]